MSKTKMDKNASYEPDNVFDLLVFAFEVVTNVRQNLSKEVNLQFLLRVFHCLPRVDQHTGERVPGEFNIGGN